MNPTSGNWTRSQSAARKAIPPLAIHCIEAEIGKEYGKTFRRVQHHDLGADYVHDTPPFNDSEFRNDDDVRWHFSVPPKGNANFVPTNGSMSLNSLRK